MSAAVLGALVGTLFPEVHNCSIDSSGTSTPVDEVPITLIFCFFESNKHNMLNELFINLHCF